MKVRPESPADRAAVARATRLAFGRPDEASLVDALRAGGHARLSLVAEAGDAVVGHVMFSALEVVDADARRHDALALAPVSVVPDHRGRGIGGALIREGLRLLAADGHGVVLVLGDPAFYARLGFSAELAGGLDHDFPPDAFLALELRPGALRGVGGRVVYPPPFGGS